MSDIHHTSSDADSLIKQIEALNREKQQLISLVSHDLRSPLNRAFALAELLLMNPESLTDFQKDYLEKMRLVIADGLAMMRNLVDYRNLEFRSIDVMNEAVNVGEFVEKLVRDFKSIADKKKIVVQIIHAAEVVIHSDKQCLDRILSNLLSNAFKFSKAGQKVLIRILKNSDQKTAIEIEDMIGGFSSEEIKTLFTPFKKYRAQPTGNESSTGLGLFVAKAMADQIGGTITCQTEEGKGSIFTVLLPS